MVIDFDNPKHELWVNNYELLRKKFGHAVDILKAIDVLQAADSLSDIPRSYRPHPLKAEYKGCFAVNVTKTHRVIFRPNHNGDASFRIDNYKTITSISIIEIFTDYH